MNYKQQDLKHENAELKRENKDLKNELVQFIGEAVHERARVKRACDTLEI